MGHPEGGYRLGCSGFPFGDYSTAKAWVESIDWYAKWKKDGGIILILPETYLL